MRQEGSLLSVLNAAGRLILMDEMDGCVCLQYGLYTDTCKY